MIKYILLALILGILGGYLNNMFTGGFANSIVTDYLFMTALVALLFIMGLAFGIDKEAMTKMRQTGLKVLIVPVVIAFSSVLAGLIGGLIFKLDLISSMAVTAGYGWYTMTGPILNQMLGNQWGALGFAANFLRELLTIVAISLWVRIDKYAPVAAGGATTMDTTLPVIVRYCGNDILITAFSSGFILSMTAPFSVIAILSLK